MDHPEFDIDGYPTEATLEAIKNWPVVKSSQFDFAPLMTFVEEAWHYKPYFVKHKRRIREWPTSPLVRKYEISTAGWSGNESLIEALRENSLFWNICWVSSKRGGHYVFHVR